MSWLYSMLFAGLLFSSNGTVPTNLNFSPAIKKTSALSHETGRDREI